MKKPEGWDAHHIVAAGAQNKFAKDARDIIEKAGIDKNSSAKGVYLPKEKGVSMTVIDGQTMATHNGGHAMSYYEFVYRQLLPVKDNKKAIEETLNFIREELMNGRLETGNIKKYSEGEQHESV